MLAGRKRVGEETGVSSFLGTIVTCRWSTIVHFLPLNFNSESVKFEMDFNSSVLFFILASH